MNLKINKKMTPLILAAIILITAMVPLFSSAMFSGAKEQINGVENKRIVAYYPNWGIYSGHDEFLPSYAQWDNITHMNLAFYGVDNGGNIKSVDTWADFEKPLYPGTAWDDPNKGVVGSMRKEKEANPNAKLMLSIGGWSLSAAFPILSRDPSARANFAQQSANFVIEQGFDGIDIDWEYPGLVRDPDKVDNPNDQGHPNGLPDDGKYYIELLKDVREKLDEAGKRTGKYYELSIAAPAGMDKIGWLDGSLVAGNGGTMHWIREIGEVVDFINIMSYDLHGTWDSFTGHHSGIYADSERTEAISNRDDDNDFGINKDVLSDEDVKKFAEQYAREEDTKYYTVEDAAAAYARAGVPKNKLVVGSPFYSRGWYVDLTKDYEVIQGLPGLYAPVRMKTSWEGTMPDAPKGDWDGGLSTGVNPYYKIKDWVENPSSGYKRYFDPVTKTPYAFNETNGEFYTYEDVESATARANFVKDNGYGGIIFWEATGDTKPGYAVTNELTKAIKKAFYGDRKIPTTEGKPSTPDEETSSSSSNSSSSSSSSSNGGSTEKPDSKSERKLVGYLHNWGQAGGEVPAVTLDDISDKYDVIHIAFPSISPDGTVVFTSDWVGGKEIVTPEQVKRAVSKGKTVTLSIGGQNAQVVLDTPEKVNNFVKSYIDIAKTYGLNGIDIDIEHGVLAQGNVNTPTPAQLGVINATKAIIQHFESNGFDDFELWMAPESANVMGGINAYGNAYGNYIPIINALREELTGLHVQFYNTGSLFGIDGKIYYQGTADFAVAMADALIKGFDVSGGGRFEGLPAEKIFLGLPSTDKAAPAGGYMSNAEIEKAFKQLTTNEKLTSYSSDTNHINLGGVMTWSINWDIGNGYNFANGVRQILDGIPTGDVETPDPETPDPETPEPEKPEPEKPEPEKPEPEKPNPEKPNPGTGSFDPNKVYNTGDRVEYNGGWYTANWWTQGGVPAGNPNWTPDKTSNPDGSINYVPGQSYEKGDVVKYNGKRYEAQWWTASTPGSDDSWKSLDISVNSDGSVDYVPGQHYTEGQKVKYKGTTYIAKWWTTSTPGSDESWRRG